LSEWRGVRVEEFGFKFGLRVFGIKAFEVGIGERGGKGRGRRSGWKGETGSEIV
jgi:hypothetical protein